MNLEQYRMLHRELSVCVPKTIVFNPLPSATDPTQDIPIRAVELAANGAPINVKDLAKKMPFSNIPVDGLTSIERRNTDKFDQLGELQGLVGRASKVPDASTNFKHSKTSLKHEN